jgi:tetratricopeptide (TPR) repeat protein
LIERMLQAERNLAMGLTDQAETLYRRAIDSDPRNAIAVVGLARVALARDDEATAYRLAVDALRIDPENAAALRLESRLYEVLSGRGVSLEREPLAVRAAEAEAERNRRALDQAARPGRAVGPGRPDYAPTRGTRFAEVMADESRRPSLLRRLFGRRP